MNPTTRLDHKVVSRSDWIRIRSEFLATEKELTHLSDEIACQRQELTWTLIEKDYFFTGPQSRLSLADLFAGKSQLATYHFMFGPDWNEVCPGCSYLMDLNGAIYRTYSGYGRGLESILGTYAILDRAPKGRDEDKLPAPMAWVRHHDKY